MWPAPPTRPVGPVVAPGAPPVLVVGTTNDPATPYAWAVNVSKQLAHGVLLTRDGDDHVAYFYSACVRGYVDSYLVGGVTPSRGHDLFVVTRVCSVADDGSRRGNGRIREVPTCGHS